MALAPSVRGRYSARSLATVLRKAETNGLSKAMLGEFLGGGTPWQ